MTKNKILTQNAAIGLDGRKHRRNLNILVCGGSGAGKTRFFAKPNIMNANTSFVCLDPKSELLRDTGNLLKAKGYDIKVIDLMAMLSIYGTEDKVLDFEKYEKYRNNLPDETTEFVIDGGCHAGFGCYGPQDGDGTPTLTNEEQIALTAEEITAGVQKNL